MIVYTLHGERIAELTAHGPKLDSERDANELLAETIASDARMLVIPATRLSDDFFRLSTRKAGLFLQKFVNYQVRVVIAGDIEARAQESAPLADFVRESNRGQSVWFLRDVAQLSERLAPAA